MQKDLVHESDFSNLLLRAVQVVKYNCAICMFAYLLSNILLNALISFWYISANQCTRKYIAVTVVFKYFSDVAIKYVFCGSGT